MCVFTVKGLGQPLGPLPGPVEDHHRAADGAQRGHDRPGHSARAEHGDALAGQACRLDCHLRAQRLKRAGRIGVQTLEHSVIADGQRVGGADPRGFGIHATACFGDETDQVFLVRHRHAHPTQSQPRMVDHRADGGLEMLPLGRDRERCIEPVETCCDKIGIVCLRTDRVLDRPSDDAVQACRGADPLDAVKTSQLVQRRLTRRRGLVGPIGRKGQKRTELGCKQPAQQAEAAHAQGDHGLSPLREQIERFEVVAERAGLPGDFHDRTRRLGGHLFNRLEQIARPALETVGREDQVGVQVALATAGKRVVDAPSQNAIAVIPLQLDVNIARRPVGADGVVIQVQEFPDDEVLEEMECESPFDLLGLYAGVDMVRRSVTDVPENVDMIFLYRRPILDYWCETGDDLVEVVRHVLIHEIGHHFGFSDADMERIEAEA